MTRSFDSRAVPRRTLLTVGLTGVAGAFLRPGRARAAAGGGENLGAALTAIEARSGGRLGVALLGAGEAHRSANHRGDELFPMCSTFKTVLAAAVLARVDRGEETLDRRIAVTAADIVPGSPFTQARVGAEAPVGDLCEATMTLSDNAAANLLLPSIGGPDGLTRFARSVGDAVTRLDRIEPALNEALPGDPRDTTSPQAMAATYRTLVFGETLTPASRGRLVRWLVDSQTGRARLRAGLPADWIVGDKTGVGERGTTNDVAVGWPPHGEPLVLACYLTASPLDPDARNAVHAEVARAVAAWIG